MLDIVSSAAEIQADQGKCSAADLSAFQTVFCDSLQALETAYLKGLSREATVLTRSPALLMCRDISTQQLDAREHVNKSVLDEFFLSTSEFLQECLKVLRASDDIEPFAVLACRAIWNWQQRALFAAFLTDADFLEPRLVVDPVLESADATERMRLPWRKLLASNDGLRVFDVSMRLEDFRATALEGDSLLERLYIRGIAHFQWRFVRSLWERVPDRFGGRRFYYLKDSEIVRDVGLTFAKRGFRVGQIKIPSSLPSSFEHPLACRIVSMIEARISARLRAIAPRSAIKMLIDDLKADIAGQLNQYDAALRHFACHADEIFPRRGAIVVSNYPYGGAALALAHAAHEAGAVFAGVQHGVGRELLAVCENECNYENSSAPYALLFNETAETITARNPFRHPKARQTSVGAPRDFLRVGRKVRLRKVAAIPPVLYVQMLDRTGSFFNGGIYKDDLESCEQEIRLVNDVFARIPHRVGFKYYPYRSYVDIDPVRGAIESASNVDIVESGRDLRFLLAGATVVVAIGTSSTLSWCLSSGKPVIYLDPRAVGYRMAPEIRQRHPSAVFYFDTTAEGFFDELRAFLSRPLAEIEADWRAGDSERQAFLRQYIGAADGLAGERAYHWLNSMAVA